MSIFIYSLHTVSYYLPTHEKAVKRNRLVDNLPKYFYMYLFPFTACFQLGVHFSRGALLRG